MLFIPTNEEQELLSFISNYNRNDYVLIRLTDTMLDKSIIDASGNVRALLKNYNILDYNSLIPGVDKLILDGFLINNSINEQKISFYRPKTKKGDPRFWPYNFKKNVAPNEMIYISVFKNKVCIIPLVKDNFNYNNIKSFFASNSTALDECLNLLKNIMHKDILSLAPDIEKPAPKDIGATLEHALNIPANSCKKADFKNQIEIKGKIKGKKTKDTLFSMVPNWELSEIHSSTDMILSYGYPTRKKKHPGFIDLYVTVSNKPNAQGLYLEVDEENQVLIQKHKSQNGSIECTCVWTFNELKKRLNEKHPETLWVLGEVKIINNLIHFNYEKVQHSKSPIFSSFLMLISQGIITFDWRGRVRPDRTGYKDKGHCFRLNPKFRHLLFGEIEDINI